MATASASSAATRSSPASADAILQRWSRAIATFIGVDLAWQSDRNHSGLAAFRGHAKRVTCLELSSGISTLAAVHRFIADHQEAETVVAIDAPLIVENASGQRPCERLVNERFASFDAGAHPSNRSLYPKPGGVELARRLAALGYTHCLPPDETWKREGRWFFEVYPHPAHVVLFERSRIIKYKRGQVAARRLGLREFQGEIRSRVFGPMSPFRQDSACREFLARGGRSAGPSAQGTRGRARCDPLRLSRLSPLALGLGRERDARRPGVRLHRRPPLRSAR